MNNRELTADERIILTHEMGVFDEDDENDCVDTRDTLEMFRASCQEFNVREREFQGLKYSQGQIQRAKGESRRSFIFIPGDPFNVVRVGA